MDASAPADRKTPWIWILPLLLVVAAAPVALYLVYTSFLRPRPGLDELRGGEVRYRLLFPADYKGDRQAALARTTTVLSKRLLAAGLKKFRVAAAGQEAVTVGFDGVSEEQFQRLKWLAGLWHCELREVAPASLQQRWKPGDPAPEGFVALPDDDLYAGEWTRRTELLVAPTAIVDGGDLKSASALEDPGGPGNWIVQFELTEAGARKLDDAAARMYAQQPHGRIAIVKNGRVHSKPMVQSPRIGARVQINGTFRKLEAESLAVVLENGALPVPIGRRVEGRDEPGQPESEAYVDLTPRRN